MTARRVLAAAVLALLTACGVPADSEPRVVKDSDVPFDLLSPTSTPSSTVPG
ncbi:MAG: hypothetical protein ACRD12_13135 [Acidimicrobiales bacterium]